MGKVILNNRDVECPDQLSVKELKELCGISEGNLVYDEDGNILSNGDVLDTSRSQRFGSVEDYTRG